MNHIEALEKLKQYKSVEGNKITNGTETLKIKNVVAAPYSLDVFGKYYREFIENNVAYVNIMPKEDYDIYFYENPYAPLAGFIRLDDFLANYKVI